MGLFRESRHDRAHVRVLENTYICLGFLAQATKVLNSSQGRHAQQMFSESLSKLTSAYSGKPITYQDYEPMVTAARKISGLIWNPNLNSVTNLVAALTNTLDETGWQIDNEPELFVDKKIEIPDVVARLKAEQSRLGKEEDVELPPYQRMIRESDLRAIGEALDAAEGLHEINGQAVAPEHKSLAKLNVEFISEPILNAWLVSMGQRDALPENPACLYEAIADVESHFHASAETKERLADDWSRQRPELDPEWIYASASALLSSACSTKMDTLHHSSVDTVRSQVESVYQGLALRARENETIKQEAEGNLRDVQDALMMIEAQLHRLESRLPGGVTSATAKELKATAERLAMKTEIALESLAGPNEEDDPRPA